MNEIIKAIGVVAGASFFMTLFSWLFATTLGSYFRIIGFLIGLAIFILLLYVVAYFFKPTSPVVGKVSEEKKC
jgi:ABC-type Fe3+-siderophore transport system permease subunit